MAARCQSVSQSVLQFAASPLLTRHDMKVCTSLLLLSLAALVGAEPPVPNYSTTHQDAFSPPPQGGPSSSYGAPSSDYGPPRQTTAILRPSPSYGAPPGQSAFRGRQRHGGSNFGGSNFGGSNFGGSNFGGRSKSKARKPSSDYGAPPSSNYGAPPSSNYGAPPSSNHGAPPSSNYGAPPSSNYGAPPSSDYGAPPSSNSYSDSPSDSYGAPPSSDYGAPPSMSHRGSPSRGRRPSSNYGAPSSGHGGGGYDDGSSEPANYQFSYHVQDASSGNDFGHQEKREGHVAKGMYMVLLPDGRRQIVEYTADENGYHPIVRYEGEANQGYPSGPSGSGGGYRY